MWSEPHGSGMRPDHPVPADPNPTAAAPAPITLSPGIIRPWAHGDNLGLRRRRGRARRGRNLLWTAIRDRGRGGSIGAWTRRRRGWRHRRRLGLISISGLVRRNIHHASFDATGHQSQTRRQTGGDTNSNGWIVLVHHLSSKGFGSMGDLINQPRALTVCSANEHELTISFWVRRADSEILPHGPPSVPDGLRLTLSAKSRRSRSASES